MKKFKRFAIRRPLLFGFLLIFIYSLLGTLTWPITQLSPESDLPTWGEALAKLVIILVFIVIVHQFGWLKKSGLIHPGSWQLWVLFAPLILYKSMVSHFAFTGGANIIIPEPGAALPITAYELGTSLLEEIMYRGLVLAAMVLAWGDSPRGLYKSALLSALPFSMLHLFNLIVNPFGEVAAQVTMAFLTGFISATFVLLSKSIWPAVLSHFLVNTAVNFWLASNPIPDTLITQYIRFTILLIPLAVFCGYLLLKKYPKTTSLKHVSAA